MKKFKPFFKKKKPRLSPALLSPHVAAIVRREAPPLAHSLLIWLRTQKKGRDKRIIISQPTDEGTPFSKRQACWNNVKAYKTVGGIREIGLCKAGLLCGYPCRRKGRLAGAEEESIAQYTKVKG
eukprot:TRINITY_DN3649_c0_g2_i1.p3 TRINITY_DN3649_c0_g2~~TRINITY_DN3649_c0_g2_i1.p3  ORF type:complete len:124 (-),score=0.64 TRINITY_DN3649_c0_g2_i1:1011-1382(-)